MIQVGTDNNKKGLMVYGINYRKRFIGFGRLDTLNPDRLSQLLEEARILEMRLLDVMTEAPMTIADIIDGNNVKYIRASRRRVRVRLPNAKPFSFTLDPVNLQADVDYLAMRVFNHINFSMEGATFQIVKSLLRRQLLLAL